MIEHVVRRTLRAPGIARTVVLTDDERIAEAVRGFGGEVEMTPAECASGTDRIAYAAQHWDAAAVVNVQGDEPLIDPEAVGLAARHLLDHPEDPMVTLAAPADAHERNDPNVVKVVTDRAGYALYFSRSRIPYPRRPETDAGRAPLEHIGLYGYQREALLELASLPVTPLEETEGLEQLRALENGIRIRVLISPRPSPGVDTRSDLERVERLLLARQNTQKGR
jgi:3-deoxy-manno-octulosonate cytidylyltransferase (CMP-KDO synthetase)